MAIIKVKTGGITADAVTDALIADDVVGTEHLTANEVDTTALGADAVTGAQLADNAVNSEHYTDGSVDTAHIADAQITTAKLSTAVFTGATDIGADLADADLILVDDGAGGTIRKAALSRIKTYAGGVNTPAFFVSKSAVQSFSNNTSTQVTYDVEVVDTDNAFASNTFTVPSGKGGKYFLFCQIRFETDADFSYIISQIKQNSTSLFSAWNRNIDYSSIYCSGFADLSAGDTIKHFATQGSGGNLNCGYIDRGAVVYLGGYKIIE